MDSAAIAIVLATVGVNFGWQPTSEGPAGYEYTVQIEPEIAELMRRGESLPIESDVPAEVAPIRKVRIVVGRGDVARSPLQSDELIVRGQSPDDRTAGPAGESSPWTESRYNLPATANVDRYGIPSSSTARGVAPPPGFSGRVGGAVDETAGALRAGLEAGFAEANEQLSGTGADLWQSARGATQNGAQQLEATGDNLRTRAEQSLHAVGDQARQAAESLGVTGSQPSTVAAPPWSHPSIGVITPIAGQPPTRTASGPTFPASAGRRGERDPIHSVLADPWGDAQTPDQNEAGRTTTATGASSAASNSDLVPIRPVTPRVPERQPTGGGFSDPWINDPWEQPPQASPESRTVNDSAMPPADHDNDWSTGGTTPPTVAGGSSQPIPQAPPANSVRSLPQETTTASTRAQATAAAPTETVPWQPLLFVSLGLVCSLSANLFLGWSYIDARHRYMGLVRKSAQTFRRRTTEAA